MTDREFDKIIEWLFDSGVRLRTFASVWLTAFVMFAACGWFLAVLITGDDRTNYCYDNNPAKIKQTPTAYCRGDDLVRPTEWGLGGEAVHVAEIFLLIGAAGFLLPMTNTALLGARGYSRVVRLRWTRSATKKALGERKGRLKAEALSEAAERET
jgi:hypothetical protein